MRAVAASRKIAVKRDHSSNADKSGNNNSSSHGGIRQKGSNQRSSQPVKNKQSGYSSTSFYTAVPTSQDAVASAEAIGDSLPISSSVVGSRSRGSLGGGVTTKPEDRKTSPTAPARSETPMSSKSLDFAEHRMQSPSSSTSTGPKKNIKDLMPRNISNLSHGASSAGATNAGGASILESRLGAKRRAKERRYYAKPIALMVVGVCFLIVGVVFACLHFLGWKNLLMAGPISLSVGLLLFVCGIVWTSIMTAKLKRQQQIMSRTFSA